MRPHESPAVMPVVWAQKGVVIIHKPAGLASTGRDLDDPNCAQFVLREQLGGRRPVWAVHQLDRLTSGLNVFVTRKSLVSTWASRMAAETTTKTYLAVCRGPWAVAESSLLVETPIGRRREGRKTFPCLDGEGARSAKSVVRRVASNAESSLVAVDIHTGRTHQVRLHLAGLGLPILGDPLHGVSAHRGSGDASLTMGLHSWRLSMAGPLESSETSQAKGCLDIAAPIPPALERLAQQAGLSFSHLNS